MPVELPMKFSRSRRLVFEKRRLSGSLRRRVEHRLLACCGAPARASLRSAAAAAPPRAARAARGRARRPGPPPSGSTDRTRWPCGTRAAPRRAGPRPRRRGPRATCTAAAACMARSSAILYSALVGRRLQRLAVVLDRLVPLLGVRRAARRGVYARPAPHPATSARPPARRRRPLPLLVSPRGLQLSASTARTDAASAGRGRRRRRSRSTRRRSRGS